jgi:hypothetical protein
MKEYMNGPRKFFPSLAISLCFATSLIAQQPTGSQPPPPTESQQNPDAPKTSDQGQDQAPPAPADAPTPGVPIDSQIRPAGRALPWYGSSSPLQWGSFSIRDVAYDHIYDRFFPAVPSPSEDINVDIFRASLVFDKAFRGQRIVLQYVPQLALINGDVANNGGFNNVVVLGTVFQISPRLSVSVRDEFTQVHSRELYPPEVLAVDQQAGNLIQNQYLQNAGSYLSNSVGAVVNYNLTPRLIVTVAPFYTYTDVTDTNGVNYVADGHTITMKASLIYALTPRQNVGVVYGFEALRASGVEDAGQTNFTSAALYYGYQVSKTWWFRGSIGANRTTYGDGIQPVVTTGGDVSVLKVFGNSTFALAYARGRMATNFITPNIGNREDATYSIHMTRRLTWNAGGGIYNETGVGPQTKGSYAMSGMDFGLSPSLVLHAGYIYSYQRSSTLQLLSGIRNTCVVSLRWEPQLIRAH